MTKIVAILACILFSSISWAKGNNIQYGFAPSLSFLSLSDPDGSVEGSVSLSAFNGIVKMDAPWRYSSWVGEMGFQKNEHSAGVNQIGQKSHTWNFAGGLEMRYALTRKFDFFPAVLLGIAQTEYASRHTIDSDGYLAEKLDARSASEPFIKLQAAYYGRLTRKWEWGIVPAYQKSLGDGYSGFVIGANFLY